MGFIVSMVKKFCLDFTLTSSELEMCQDNRCIVICYAYKTAEKTLHIKFNPHENLQHSDFRVLFKE